MPHPSVHSGRPLGTTGLLCHPLGFGCYRIHLGSEVHEAALRAYLDRGGNLIDTSANYTDGLSESLVGQVLRDYPRDRVIVVTKGGYIQGQNMELAQKKRFPEVVQYGEGIWHCIHPEFLEAQIDRSLERLRLESIDVYLLHNPEYFLTEKEHHGGPVPADHEEFYRRICAAFRFLEREVARGRIRWYGISSNNYGLPGSDRTVTSVSRCLAEARRIQADHHFRVIQLPMNLYESGGALDRNNGDSTVLEFSSREGLGVLVNRPLNAFFNNRMVRLADFVSKGSPAPGRAEMDALLGPIAEHEKRMSQELQIPLAGGAGKGVAEIIEEMIPHLDSPSHWERVAGPHVIRPLQGWISNHRERFSADARGQSLLQRFIELVNTVFEEVTRFLAYKEQAVSDRVRAELHESGYPPTEESLSRMSMNVLLNLPGLSCVLNGMRRVEYVEDALGTVGLNRIDGLAILQDFHRRVS